MVASNSLTVRGDILDGSWLVARSVRSLTVIEGISSMGPTLNPTIRTGGTLWVVVLEVRWVNQTTNLSERVLSKQQHQIEQLLTMDISVLATMKNAAKCDT